MRKFNKSLGQNFLTNQSIITRAVDQLSLGNDADIADIIEIGAGSGAITTSLVSKIDGKSNLYVIEIDERLAKKLTRDLAKYNNTHVINEDFLSWFESFKTDEKYKIIGALPFYITSPIIHKIIKHKNKPEMCVLLIQKEVAEKIVQKKPRASYISVFVQTFFDVEYIEAVNKQNFEPVPKVDGAIIKLSKKSQQLIPHEEIEKYENFLHRGFSNPRKMINKVFTKEQLTKIGQDGNLRPQNLNVQEWINIYKILVE